MKLKTRFDRLGVQLQWLLREMESGRLARRFGGERRTRREHVAAARSAIRTLLNGNSQ